MHRKQIVTFFLLAASSGLFAFFVLNCVRALLVKGPIWYEGPVLGFINTIRLGRLYQLDALHTQPYSVLTHTPLSYLLDYAIYSVIPALWPLRLLNIVLTLCCALLVAKLARFENPDHRVAGWFAASLFLVCTPVFFWSQVARCTDALACLFSLLAITALVTLPSSFRREVAVGVFWALAVLSKQTAAVVLAPALFGYDFFLTRDRSRIYWRFLFCGAVLLPIFIYLQWSTHGGFSQNVIAGNLVRATAAWWLMVTLRLKSFWLLILVVALLGGLRKSATSIWFVTSLAFGLYAVAKRGADMMYFFDTSAALAIMAAGIVISLPQMRRPLLKGAALAITILAMSINDLQWLVSSAGDEDYSRMIAWLSSHASPNGQILSDDAGISLALGQNPVSDDPFILAEWSARGVWRNDALMDGIRAGKYSAVVVSDSNLLWFPAERNEVAKGYTLVKVFRSVDPGPKCIYVPNAVMAAGTQLEPLVLSPADKQNLPCNIGRAGYS
ncbi:MAG: hypothetical protein ABSB30_16550 [Terracidiphilus sp.]|jgi:hypothetical protein